MSTNLLIHAPILSYSTQVSPGVFCAGVILILKSKRDDYAKELFKNFWNPHLDFADFNPAL
jgi:hypothetical protein